jgi:hypothetical protein
MLAAYLLLCIPQTRSDCAATALRLRYAVTVLELGGFVTTLRAVVRETLLEAFADIPPVLRRTLTWGRRGRPLLLT